MSEEVLVLASNSPRRKMLLSALGYGFGVSPADIDETPQPDEQPGDYVVRLARTKARTVAPNAPAGLLIVAADTTVAYRGQILGKPQDADEAAQMLAQLRDRWHQVYTGIAVYDPEQDRLETILAVTEVHMRPYSEAEAAAYIAGGDPFDKAGGYAIQNEAFHPVDRIEGCYSNVVGLPLCHLACLLQKFGLALKQDLPLACEQNLGYKCSECEAILLANLEQPNDENPAHNA